MPVGFTPAYCVGGLSIAWGVSLDGHIMLAIAAPEENTPAASQFVNSLVQTWFNELHAPEMGDLQDLTQPCPRGPGTHFAPWVTRREHTPGNAEWERSPFQHRCECPESDGWRTLPNFFTALPGVAGSFYHRKVAAFARTTEQARRLCQAFGLLQAAVHLGATPQICPRIHHHAPVLSGIWARTLYLAPHWVFWTSHLPPPHSTPSGEPRLGPGTHLPAHSPRAGP